jgi:hypothetical protein
MTEISFLTRNLSTMSISEFLETLSQQGVQVWVDEDKLRINSPKGALTADLRTALAERKTEILSFLRRASAVPESCEAAEQGLSLQTIGRLIGGFSNPMATGFKPPTIAPIAMAKKLRITFRPLPQGYQNQAILKFRDKLQAKLERSGVEIIAWEDATKEFQHEVTIPLLNWKKTIKTRAVKSNINAMIDVERSPSTFGKFKVCVAENLYQAYSRFVLKDRKMSVSRIAQFISWAEDNIHDLEDPTNTQVIVLTDLNTEFIDPHLPYPQKIPIGVNTLVKTFSEIVIGVSETRISILNMNLSDSVFPVSDMDDFVNKSLIPKIYVPILPLPLSRFEIGEYDSTQSVYAERLVKLGQGLASTGLLPTGFKINDVVKRKSHRDIVDWMANGRTGVSYGFVAYAEPPRFLGSPEVSATEWQTLTPVEGFSSEELRQNPLGRWYLKTKIGQRDVFKQIPDIWLVSSRSGSNKTDLRLETDVLRIGLQGKLMLQLPQGIDPAVADIKPSYDLYVMVALALAAALYAPKLIENGMPIVHFHGYPSIQWFKAQQEYYAGVHNPSVPCGTYESGVFNFLGVHDLVNQHGDNFALACLVEPDHGANIIAHDLDYLLTRLHVGVEQQQIELGGRYFSALKESAKVPAAVG